MKKHLILFAVLLGFISPTLAQKPVPERPRILISTDIGGTDPDDNQSMMHFLLYCNEFDTEGIVSSPSYGDGNKSEILRMIDLYAQDLKKLKKHSKTYPSPDKLRAVTKQGRHGTAAFAGYSEPTEGSEWIVTCAKKKDKRPLYVLVWGGLDDLAQALHDAPEIATNIRVYWIGGPNKKWSVNSYIYIIEHFPDLWFIENNSTYRSFIANRNIKDKYNAYFYENFVKGCGNLGADFYNYLKGIPKLGDTPSLLYMLDGNPAQPERESWGGSFERCSRTPRSVFNHTTTAKDTAQVYSIIEWHVNGPVLPDSCRLKPYITLHIAKQDWQGYYIGNGEYMVRYSTYKMGTQPYSITSTLKGFTEQNGFITIANGFPGKESSNDYKVGCQWFTDKAAPELYWNEHQGAMTISKWRKAIIEDWGKRCSWLK